MAALRPYDIQPGETVKAYEAFAAYRDMGTGRSLERVAEDGIKAVSTLRTWCQRHHWVDRARAFDEDTARRATTKSRDDHATVRARQARHARVFQAKAVQRMKSVGAAGPDGKVSDDDKLTPAEAIQAFKVGAQEERAALGIQTGKTVTDAEGNVLYKVYEGTSPDDL